MEEKVQSVIVRESDEDWVPTKLWFHYITGVGEEEFIEMKEKLIVEEGEGGALGIRNWKTKEVFGGGRFLVYGFGDLVGKVMGIEKVGKKGDKVVKILEKGPKVEKKKEVSHVPVEFLNRTGPDDSKSVDVGHLQSLPEFNHALFQVASNFNAIEGVSELQSPDTDSFTENYYRDRTQGPSASISAGAAAILRVHAPFYNPKAKPSAWNQSSDQQVELLKNLEEYFPYFNGYVLYENGIHLDTYKKFPEYHSKAYYKLFLHGLIAYHKNVQVTTGFRWFPKGEPLPSKRDDEKPAEDESLLAHVKDPNQRIDQVFIAAVNMNQGRSGPKNKSAPNSTTKARMILELGYQGTYLAALAENKQVLVLTLVGGGAFGNDKAWIFDAIVDAHRRWGLEGRSLKKVCVIVWGKDEEVKPLEELLKGMGVKVTWRHTH